MPIKHYRINRKYKDRLNIFVGMAIILCCVMYDCRVNVSKIFFDDFDDNDITDWSLPQFKCINVLQYPMDLPEVSGGLLKGKCTGYECDEYYNFMMKEFPFDGSNGFGFEIKCRSGASWPNYVAIFLFEDLVKHADGNILPFYGIYFYGEANKFILLRSCPKNTVVAKRLGIYPNDATKFHIYRIERDKTGEWSLWIDGRKRNDVNFKRNNEVNNFRWICLHLHRNQSMVDWIKIIPFSD